MSRAAGQRSSPRPPRRRRANGVVTFDGLSLLDAADGYELAASASGPLPASRRFDIRASRLAFISPSSARVAGQPFSVQLHARDARNNLAENFHDAVELSASAPGGGDFAGGTKTADGVGGVVTFDGLRLDTAAKGYSLRARAGVITVGSSAFDVAPDVVSRTLTLKLSGRHASGVLRTGAGPRCRSGMIVRIQRRTSRGWITVGIDSTNEAGAYRERIGNRPGTYRAVTLRDTWPTPTTVCRAAFSPKIVREPRGVLTGGPLVS